MLKGPIEKRETVIGDWSHFHRNITSDYSAEKSPSQILVIDIGGSHIKMMCTGKDDRRRFSSGPKMTPKQMVAGVLKLTKDWSYQAISIGYPGAVLHGRPDC